MTDTKKMALLPIGMADILPPDATFEADILNQLMTTFSSNGYERIKPPLIEFEDGLLCGLGTAMATQTFRLMDPISQRMMGVRADMTPQVARIAATRLKKSARPLRLSYSGDVLRVKGTQLRPERQFTQVGAEIIGAGKAQADAEVVLLAIEALSNLGVKGLSVDLAIPTLIPALCNELMVSSDIEAQLRMALDRKDAASVNGLSDQIGQSGSQLFSALLGAAGPADKTMQAMNTMRFGPKAAAKRTTLNTVVDLIKIAVNDTQITIDPVENRGFEYHNGVTFTIFAHGVRGEIGSGGRYLIENGTPAGEAATGFTLFMDTILRALPRPKSQDRIYLPFGTSSVIARKLRADGWIAVNGLEKQKNEELEAKHLQCTHLLHDNKISKLNTDQEG
jgi:ATP phosphoribosyltransferase regulatory subunit